MDLSALSPNDLAHVQISLNDLIDWERLYKNKIKCRYPTNNIKTIVENRLNIESELFLYIKSKNEYHSIPVKFFIHYDSNQNLYFLQGKENNPIQTLIDEYYCHIPFTLFSINLAGEILYLSDNLKSIGLSRRNQLIGCSISEILDEPSFALAKQLLQSWNAHGTLSEDQNFQGLRSSFTGYPFPLQLNFVDNGKIHPAEAYYRIYKIDEKQIISGLVRSNKAQKDSISKVLRSFNNTPHPIYRYTFNRSATSRKDKFIFSFINASFTELLGYSEDDLIGKSIFLIFFEDDLDEIYNIVSDRYNLFPVETSYKFYIKKKNGESLHAMVHAFPFIYHSNQPAFVQGAIHDLSKEDDYKEKIEDTNQYLDLMVSAADLTNQKPQMYDFIIEMFNAMILIFENDWGVLYEIEVSDHGSRMAPVHSSELQLNDINYIYLDDEINDFFSKCANNLSEVTNSNILKSLICSIDNDLWKSNELTVYTIGFGTYDEVEFLFAFLIFKDTEISEINRAAIKYLSNFITNRFDREKNEQERRGLLNSIEKKSQKINVGEIAGEITHEVGNTINTLASSIAVLNRNSIIQANEGLRKELNSLTESFNDAVQIITKYRKWYKPSNIHEYFDPNECLEGEIIFVLRKKRRIQSEKVKLTFKAGKVFKLYMIKVRFKEICTNIILNAIDAIPEKRKGHIHISTGIENYQVFVKFVDDGVGIKQTDFEKIFENFTTKEHGSGIGLYVSKRFIEDVVDTHRKIRGRIDVKNNPSGRGATFTAYFPRGDQ